jgi:hypothetical protein
MQDIGESIISCTIKREKDALYIRVREKSSNTADGSKYSFSSAYNVTGGKV